MGFKNHSKSKQKKAPSNDAEWDDYLSQLEGQEAEVATDLFSDMNERLGESVKTLESAKQIGTKTLEKLESQGEQLKDINHGINELRQANYDNKRKLRSIKSIFGKLHNKLFSCACLKPQTEEWIEPSDEEDALAKPSKKKHSKGDAKGDTSRSHGQTPLYDLYKKTEDGLDRVGDLTSDLEKIALQMGKTIHNQNINLDRVIANADKAIAEMQVNTDRANATLT